MSMLDIELVREAAMNEKEDVLAYATIVELCDRLAAAERVVEAARAIRATFTLVDYPSLSIQLTLALRDYEKAYSAVLPKSAKGEDSRS